MAETRRRPKHLVEKGGAMTDLNTRTPSGEDVTQRTAMKPAFSEDLLEQVLQPESLEAAWKRVRANKGAAGIDDMTIDAFPAWVRSGEWEEVLKELETGQYYPFPVRRVEIEKPEGGKRQLGIHIIADRVIQ
jgi:RNA-directed DNA polymerase